MYELIFTDGYDITREVYSSYDEAYSAMKSHFDIRNRNDKDDEWFEASCSEWSAILCNGGKNVFVWRIFKVSSHNKKLDWISIKERMPKPFDYILMSDGENVESGHYDNLLEGGRRWVPDEPHCYGEITHWCEIPNTDEIYKEVYGEETW